MNITAINVGPGTTLIESEPTGGRLDGTVGYVGGLPCLLSIASSNPGPGRVCSTGKLASVPARLSCSFETPTLPGLVTPMAQRVHMPLAVFHVATTVRTPDGKRAPSRTFAVS